MDISDLLKIFGVGVAGAITTVVLSKSGKPEIALVIDIILIASVLGYAAYKVYKIMQDVSTLFGV